MKSNIISEIESYLEKNFESDQNRLMHIYSVRDMALKLGQIYHVDLFKLEVASLLHDFTKNQSIEESYQLARYKFSEAEMLKVPEGCYHAYSASVKAEKMFLIEDQEILNAIKYHCSGRIFQSKVEQIVFISDYIEENRVFVDESLRQVARKDLNLVTYYIFDETNKYLTKKNRNVASLSNEALLYYKNKTEVINER